MKALGKIISAIFLVVTLGLVVYLSVNLKSGNGYSIQIIAMEGNVHLTKEQYLSYANLLDRNNYASLSLQVIKDRIEKHPYVERADVRYDGNGQVSISITEKSFIAILLNDDNQFIVTDKLQVLPVFDQTKKIDYPIIANTNVNGAVQPLASMRNNFDVVTAAKIISSVKLLNPELYDSFSSIDLENGGDIILNLSSVNYPIRIGRGSEIRKIVYLNNLWNYLKGKEINQYLDYVDLRYGGHVYLGILESSNGKAETNSNEGLPDRQAGLPNGKQG